MTNEDLRNLNNAQPFLVHRPLVFDAIVLHLLGFDREKLTYRYNGRDFRLTDVYGNVVKQIVA